MAQLIVSFCTSFEQCTEVGRAPLIIFNSSQIQNIKAFVFKKWVKKHDN